MTDNIIKVTVEDLDALDALAKNLAKEIAQNPSHIIYLSGDLGAGKTTLVQRILAHLGYQGKVKSPTYTYVESYSLGAHSLHHFDLYRISEPQELDFIGIDDYFTDDSCVMIEWPSRGEGAIPSPTLTINIDLNDDSRVITIENKSCKERDI